MLPFYHVSVDPSIFTQVFHNILVDLGDLDDPVFKLIDANIDEKGRDITSDLSKLLQSCDALGDFLHEGLFEMRAFKAPGFDAPSPWKIELRVGSGSLTQSLSGGASGAEVFRYTGVREQLNTYRQIADTFEDIISCTVNGIRALDEDSFWRDRAVFGLAINLLTSPALFVARNPEMALAFAVSGAMVLTEWCHRKNVKPKLPENLFNSH